MTDNGKRPLCAVLTGCVLSPVVGRRYFAGTWQGQAVVVRVLRCERCEWWAIDRFDPATLARIGHREFAASAEALPGWLRRFTATLAAGTVPPSADTSPD